MEADQKQEVVIIEDDRVVGALLQEKVNHTPGFVCHQVFGGVRDFFSARPPMQILLLDVNLKEESGIDAIEPILEAYPDAAIVMNTIRDDADTIFEALKRGAVAYLDKQTISVNFEEVLQIVADGGGYMTPKIARKVFDQYFRPQQKNLALLTEREQDVTRGILEGLSYKVIADKHGIAINTVRMYVKKIYRKLRVHNRSELGRAMKP